MLNTTELTKDNRCSRCGLNVDLYTGMKGACKCSRGGSSQCYKIPKIIEETVMGEYYGFGLWDYILCKEDKR